MSQPVTTKSPNGATEEAPDAARDMPAALDIGAPMRDVKGKVAFITGGASGIGLGIATAFAEAGLKVVIGDCNERHLKECMTRLGDLKQSVHPVYMDVMDRQSMEAAARITEEHFGMIHVLVNNAGIQNTSRLSSMSYEDWDKLMGVNLHGIFNGIRTFLPRISRHGEGGHIITTASVHGFFVAAGGCGAYCASKYAAVALMESLRDDLCRLNIGVSVLCPGLVKTNLDEPLANLSLASEPYEIGQYVLRGMRRNLLYILTHPEFDVVIQARHDAIRASSPDDVRPGDERNTLAHSILQSSIYSAELIRLKTSMR